MALRATWLGGIALLPILALALTVSGPDRRLASVITIEPYNEAEERALLAYAPYLRKAQQLAFPEFDKRLDGDLERSAEQLSRVAAEWVEGYKVGTLKDLQPKDYLDTSNSGVKDEILSARRTISDALFRVARQFDRRGDRFSAAAAAALCLQFCQVNKYADLTSLAATLSSQHRSAKLLANLMPQLDPTQQAKIGAHLDGLEFKDLSALIAVSENLYVAFAASDPKHDLRRDIKIFRTARTLLQDNSVSASTTESIRQLIRRAGGDVPIILTSARVAWERERQLQELLANITRPVDKQKTMALQQSS